MTRSSQDDPDRLTQEEVEAALNQFCEAPADYARARSLARLRAAGLDDCTPEALLQEAMLKLWSAERRWPRGVHTLVVLTNVMHSIASNFRKRDAKGAIDRRVAVEADRIEQGHTPQAVPVQDVTPEEIANAKSELDEVQRLVAGDEDAELVVMAWADGLRGKAAADEIGLDMKKYEAARKRLMRKLESLAASRRES